MDADGRALLESVGSSRPAVPVNADVVHCGAELVGFAERFYGIVFRGMLALVGVAAVAALALMPLRKDVHLDVATTVPIALAGLLVAIVGAALYRSIALYRLLRRRAAARLGLVLVAAALVAHPDLSSGLWWPACACLMLLATVATMRGTLAGCLVALTANLLGHLVAGDWAQTPPISIVGLWIGLPLWSTTVSITTDLLAAHLLGLNTRQAPRHSPASQIRAETIPTDAGRGKGGGSSRAEVFERVAQSERAPDDAVDAETPPVPPAFSCRINRLTSR